MIIKQIKIKNEETIIYFFGIDDITSKLFSGFKNENSISPELILFSWKHTNNLHNSIYLKLMQILINTNYIEDKN